VPLIILGAVAEPLIVEPLFFQITPLASSQPHLAERIESVVKRAGLEIRRIDFRNERQLET